MKRSADAKDRILDAACARLAAHGAASITVGAVARAAKVSSALVHYHFATKQRLVAAAAARLAAARTARRAAALESAEGLAALDALWNAVADRDAANPESSWLDLVLLARNDHAIGAGLRAERAASERALRAALPRLLASLGTAAPVSVDDVAATVQTFLDGVSLALASGEPVTDVRSAYDAFWLALVAAGQSNLRP